MNLWAIKECIIIRYECWIISKLLKKCREKHGIDDNSFKEFTINNRLRKYL